MGWRFKLRSKEFQKKKLFKLTIILLGSSVIKLFFYLINFSYGVVSTFSEKPKPISKGSLNGFNISTIFCCRDKGCTVKATDGNLHSWGYNLNGEVGDKSFSFFL